MKRQYGPILFWTFTAADKIKILLTQSTAAFAREERVSTIRKFLTCISARRCTRTTLTLLISLCNLFASFK